MLISLSIACDWNWDNIAGKFLNIYNLALDTKFANPSPEAMVHNQKCSPEIICRGGRQSAWEA